MWKELRKGFPASDPVHPLALSTDMLGTPTALNNDDRSVNIVLTVYKRIRASTHAHIPPILPPTSRPRAPPVSLFGLPRPAPRCRAR